MTRSPFLNRCSLAAATALAAVLAFGAVDASAGGYKQEGAMQQQSQSGAQSTHSQQHVREVQQELSERGYDVGSVDGEWGQKTSSALREFQQAEGLQPSGQIDQQTLEKLEIAGMDNPSGSTIGGEGSPSGDSLSGTSGG